jgi:hypothetical protein
MTDIHTIGNSVMKKPNWIKFINKGCLSDRESQSKFVLYLFFGTLENCCRDENIGDAIISRLAL